MKDKFNLLDIVPSKDDRILWEQKDGVYVLSLPRFKNAWVQKHLIPRSISPYLRVTLEEHGSAVWELINGEKTVREIILELGDHFNNEEDYDVRVATFLTQLKKDGLIKYHLKKESIHL